MNTKNNNTTQACAACKYQRRKCAPDCILAPYFPHDRHRQFINAHKLFGVSNINKIIKYLDPPSKDQAMRTIIFQSDMRANDPVGGCYRYIQDLQAQIEYHKNELDLVHQQLAILRAQQSQQQQQEVSYGDQVIMNQDSLLGFYNPSSGSLAPANYHYNIQNQDVPQLQEPDQEQYIMMQESNSSSINSTNTPLQQHVNNWGAMQNSISLSSLSLHGQSSNASDDYDHKPILDIPCDERNELGFDSGEILQNSDENDMVLYKIDNGVIKAEDDYIQQVQVEGQSQEQDHDLKSAATLFTLTNCNSYDQSVN
ncbi:LOB domain-containing protein 22-like [Vicia villosa]|uniref:LOB domain-containing protein 22-like n=1 Tax=Vicia villosa TaxID=3911 RepID=UPI00273B2A48|nr:LOB domain-containing protein 22-like [Vicia villosa]